MKNPLITRKNQPFRLLSLGRLGGLLLLTFSLISLPQKAFSQNQYSPYTESSKVLYLGTRGSAVTELQQRLKTLGFYNRIPNGNYDAFTKEAVIRFQEVNGLNVNGIADAQTQAVLWGTPTQTNIVSNPQEVYPGDNTYNNDYASVPPPTDPNMQEGVPVTVQSNGYTATVLQIGDVGPEVEQLQNDLTRLGYYQGPIEGLYDFPTETAVRNFQTDNGLQVTGIADQQTLAILSGGNQNNNSNGGVAVVTPPANNFVDDNPYIVVIPGDEDTLREVQPYISDAFVNNWGRGSFVQAGSFEDHAAAESRSYYLRSIGLDARVIHR